MDDRTLAAQVIAAGRRIATQPVLVLLLGMILFFSTQSEFFLSNVNWDRIQSSYFPELALLTMASTLVLLIGGIDLSVAAVSALTAVVVGTLGESGVGTGLSLVIGMATALGAGLLNGVFIVYGRISPIMTTLVTQLLFAGLALAITNGSDVTGFSQSFVRIGQDYIGRFPVQFVIVLAIAVVLAGVLHLTVLGRWIYVLGGSAPAARLAGVPVARLTIGVYAAASVLSGFAGLITAARFGSASIDINRGAELYAITASILGGVSIAGGRGLVVWALGGALAIGVLQNGMTLMNASGFRQIIAIGVLLIACVLLQQAQDRYRDWRSARLQLRPRSVPGQDSAPPLVGTSSRN